ncbi:MAG: hypothetical protein GWP91_13185, partial [Rhodobacterales bacterium]|nr:hypothetical protein [Rhodobacterales bacterium]
MQSVSTDFARVLIGVLLLAGCGSNGGDTPINDAVVGESRDVDGDGFAVGSEINRDCDDNDAAVNPDAEEVCDEIDNNCDGEIDEGVTNTFYADEDGDSFGDLDNVILSCQAGPPAGFRYESTDCDDSDAEINPDADELCDAVDRNCDGDPTLDAIDLLEFFADLDGDGEGSAANVQFACSMPPNYIENSDDCNDLNADVNTLATEICNEFDDNCDGMIDEDGAVGAPDWYVDFDGDTFGDPATGEPHCELRVPNGFVADDTDCNDQEEAINPNAQEVCDGGVDNDCDLTTDEDIEDGRLWYPDVDTDGYGASDGTPIVACEDATRVNSNTDCDDQDENIRPNAIEICNTLDDNCDGVVDEDTAVDATIWYDDADGDTYGDPATGAVRCDADGGVADDTDCDDLDIAINPIAVEVCDGGVDNDCDPTTDEDAPVFASTWYDDLDDDSFGDPATGTMRCDADGGVADATDCDDLDVAINPIAVEVCDGGVDNDCAPTTDEEIVDSSTWYFDGDGDSFGLSSNIQLGCEPLPDYVSVDGDCDDTDDTVIPGVAPDCIQLHCGTIATNETWIAAYDHVITCDVAVEGPATPILMIADGAVVRFQRDTEITVGEGDFGALFVDGVGLGGVVLTSDEATPNNGDWGGVKIGSNDVGSVLTGLTIEYGGGNGRGGLWADGSSPIVEDAELLNNQGAGYYGTDATLNMTGTTVSGNWGTGV